MFEKNGKYYADWRDRRGKRLRKSFTSKRAALLFEAEQRELAHPKTNARGRLLRPSSSRASRDAITASTPKQRGQSSPPLDQSRPANSARPTPPQSKKLYVVKGTLTPQNRRSQPRFARTSATSGSTTARRNSTTLSRVTPASARATSQPRTRNAKQL